MKLPNGDSAIIDPAKIEGYCLNPYHDDGSHKARVFRAALGLVQSNAVELKDALMEAAAKQEAIFRGLDNTDGTTA